MRDYRSVITAETVRRLRFGSLDDSSRTESAGDSKRIESSPKDLRREAGSP